MLHVTWLIILLPLVGFAVQLAGRPAPGRPGGRLVATAFVGASFVVSVGVYLDLLTVHAPVRTYTQNLWTWIPVGSLQVHARLFVDPLSMTMVLFVTGISTLIHLYSIGYMKGDRDYPKFFLYMNLFVASMLILVLGSNMLVTFVGWEGVGACSYWLVSFWFTRDSAASAGKKAFVYNRIGDVGFLLAIFLVFEQVHSLEYSTIFANLGTIGSGNITAICLLLLVGVMGKSAQIPLFPWLADAMEGPTPVSALIHAATMVTAGVYLLCRVNPLLHASPAAALTVAIVGRRHRLRGRHHRLRPAGHQEGAGLLDGVPAGLHVPGHRVRRLRGGHLLDGGPRLLQGPALPRRRLGHPRAPRRAGPQADGQPARATCRSPSSPSASAGCPSPPCRRCRASGPRATCWRTPGPPTRRCGSSGIVTAAAHRLLHEPARPGWPSSARTGGPTRRRSTPPRTCPTPTTPTGLIPEPHESPWIMTVPLWILAFFAAVAGVLALSNDHFSLSNWVDPVFGSNLYQAHLSPAAVWTLAIIDAVIAVVGVTIGLRLWMARPSGRPSKGPSSGTRGTSTSSTTPCSAGRRERLAAFSATVDRHQGHRRRGERRGHPGPQVGLAGAPDPDRLRAELRARHRPRHRAGAGLHADPAVVGLMARRRLPLSHRAGPAAGGRRRRGGAGARPRRWPAGSTRRSGWPWRSPPWPWP